ncbi:MAG: hypothetical protein JNK05_02815 [Myxococcales bacterium]|nr:hypothetical protein [Myxococcales bacterium]
MNDLVVSMVVLALMASVGFAAIQRLPAKERTLPFVSLGVHLLTAPLLLAVMDYIWVASDVHYYFETGKTLTRLMRADFARWAPEVVKFTLQMPNDLAVLFPEDFSGAYSTSSMLGVAGLLMFVFNDARYASFIAVAGVAFLGKLASYQGVRIALPAMEPRRVAIAMLLIPSVIFWSSGVVKESFAVTGLGILMLWIARATSRSLVTSPHLLVLGALPVYLFKPYLLFPFTLAAGAWIALTRLKSSNAAVKPVYLLGASAAVVGLVAALSVAFPEFSPAKLGESTSQMQQYGAEAGGGSAYTLGNAQTQSLSGQLAFAPIALVTVLVRPFVFEVRNFSMLIASGEATLMLVLLIQLFRKNSLREVFRAVLRSPPLAFCMVFTLIAGMAIGLATSNFGTLSRYRIPMMPYYAMLVLVLTDKRVGVAANKALAEMEAAALAAEAAARKRRRARAAMSENAESSP